MKYALVEGERLEAQPNLSGKCWVCGNAVIAKCGPLRVWHWAHRAAFTCDHWWEPETPWHRAWKNLFPKDWQECIHEAANGEKHVADVKTDRGVVVEFQHSFLHGDERRCRESVYKNMVWVVDGRRRARDRTQFFAALDTAVVVNRNPPILLLRAPQGALLRDWQGSSVPVYFDFGDELEDTRRFGAPVLWRLNPRGPDAIACLSPVPKTLFLDACLGGAPFDEMEYSVAVERVVARYLMQQAPRSRLPAFERYAAKKERARRRFWQRALS